MPPAIWQEVVQCGVAVSADETSFLSLRLTSCCAVRSLTDHCPAVVPSPGVGDPSSKKSEMPNFFPVAKEKYECWPNSILFETCSSWLHFLNKPTRYSSLLILCVCVCVCVITSHTKHRADYLCADFQIPFAQGNFLVKHLDTKQNCINTSGRNAPLGRLINYTSLCSYFLLFISLNQM